MATPYTPAHSQREGLTTRQAIELLALARRALGRRHFSYTLSYVLYTIVDCTNTIEYMTVKLRQRHVHGIIAVIVFSL